MSIAAQEFSVSKPLGSESASLFDDYLRNDKTALDERLSLEHNTLVSAAAADLDLNTSPGRHKRGFVSAVLADTAANITSAVGTPRDGVLSLDTDTDTLRIGGSSAWTYQIQRSSAKGHGVFSVYMSGEQACSAGTSTILFDTELFDGAGKFATYGYTPTVAGYYQINASAHTTVVLPQSRDYALYLYRDSDIVAEHYIAVPTGESYPGIFKISQLVYLSGTQTLYAKFYVSATARSLDKSNTRTYMSGFLACRSS